MDAAFNDIGKVAGLELWRIEDFKVVKIENVSGKFYKGDCYILLSTKLVESKLQYDIHFWLGSESSADEIGTAAYKAVEVDNALKGVGTQYREVQGNESALFLSYFKSTGVQYLNGGFQSGFSHVERDSWPTRLLHLKGKQVVRVQEVPLARSSLNKGDVFILDAGLKIFVFNGPSANMYEKAKAVTVAQNINSDSRGGRAAVIRLEDEPANPEFWGPLGGFAEPESLPTGEPDEAVSASTSSQIALFRIHEDDAGVVSIAEVSLPTGKLTKDLLDSGDVFVVFASGKVYVWVGAQASIQEKKQASVRAAALVKEKGLPSDIGIIRVSDGVESSAFKSEFVQWSKPVAFGAYKGTLSAGVVADPTIDVNQLLALKETEDAPLDDGSGKLEVWVIDKLQLSPIDPSKYGQFYSGDSYIVRYKYFKGNRERTIVYTWLGESSTTDEKQSAALLSLKINEEAGGIVTMVRVTENKEPAHFRQLFLGKMIVHRGGRASGFKNKVESDSFTESSEIVLFHVHGTSLFNTSARQVSAVASSLNSEDCFVLVQSRNVYVWKGKIAQAEEAQVATNVAKVLAGEFGGSGGRTLVTVDEGAEDPEFWEALGGKIPYAEVSPAFDSVPREPRLFVCSDVSGVFRIDEVAGYVQSDLLDEDVYILDTFNSVFVWIGSRSNEHEKALSFDVADRFIKESTNGRDPQCSVTTVPSGFEPTIFTVYFPDWDAEYAERQRFLDPYEAKLKALDSNKDNATLASYATTSLKHIEAPASPAVANVPAPVISSPMSALKHVEAFSISTPAFPNAEQIEKVSVTPAASAPSAEPGFARPKLKPTPSSERGSIGTPGSPVASSEPAFARPNLKSTPSSERGSFKIEVPPFSPTQLKPTGYVPLPEPSESARPKPILMPTPPAPTTSPLKAPIPSPTPLPAPPAAGSAATTIAAGPVSPGTTLAYEVLRSRDCPPGVDPTKKETYLDNATFIAKFGMDTVTFNALPKWKRDAKKKELGLF